MVGRVPNYMLTEDHVIWMTPHDQKRVPAGAFVKPIEWRWLPKHLLDNQLFMWCDKQSEIPCYTQFGIVPIPKSKLRAT